MLTDRSFETAAEPVVDRLPHLRRELDVWLRDRGIEGVADPLLLAGLLTLQAIRWRGGEGPITCRAATMGRVVHVEASRALHGDADEGPLSEEYLHALVDVLRARADRFTFAVHAGTLTLSAQKVVAAAEEPMVLDLVEAA